MLWRDPWFFWLLPAVAALGVALVALRRRRAAALATFAEAALVPRLTPDVDERRARRRLLLRVAALAVLVVALAGPKWGFHWREVRREGIDIIVALDTSRSMLATDVKPNRIERAKLAILDLLPFLQGDRIGLVPFAGAAFLECPLTLDYAAFERSLRATGVGIIPRGGTAIARAIDTSLGAFEARQGKYNVLILITDGEDHEGDVKAAAERAAELGIKIYAIGIGTPEGELLPVGPEGFVKDRAGQVVKSRLNDATLKDIALATGGAYVQGLGPSLGLDQVFRDHIATMERRELASTLERRDEDRFQFPLALALALFAIEWLMPLRRRAPRPNGSRRWWRARAAQQRLAAALILCCLPALVGWLDPPGDRAAEGNQLYASGKYEDAASRYGEGLVDTPGSPLLQFNLAAALYKQGKYDEAIAALAKVAATGDAAWIARANYNMGNAHYRLGANAETSNPQAAITAYEEALACYKRSMVADAVDTDPKANHELVTRKLAELKKRLEEQHQQQENEPQPQDQQPQDQPPQDQPQEHAGENQQPQEQPEQQAGEEQQPSGGEDEQQAGEHQPEQVPQQAEQPPEPEPGGEPQQQAGGEQPPPQEPAPGDAGGAAASEQAGEPSSPERQAAQAVLDTARGEELDPSEMHRAAGVAGMGEPLQDW